MLHLKKSTNKPSWQEEFKDSLKTYKEIEKFFDLDSTEELFYSCRIPKNFALKIKTAGSDSALWKQFIHTSPEGLNIGPKDPIGDIDKSRGNGIIHRYSSRILFTPTTVCPVICRYCFRKNELSSNDSIYDQNLECLKEYLDKHQEVNEVILTGGDPLILGNKKLEQIFSILSESNIKFVRIHTRTPIILPSRIDEGLIDLLNTYSSKFLKIIFVLHTNHVDELDSEVCTSLKKLKECRVDKKTQSVLLKGVNDNSQTLIKLFDRLLECDFTPYYLHHPDKVKGAMHFQLPLSTGRKIYLKLRDKLPGWAIPHYVIDHPNGHGKQLAFNPESIDFKGKLLNSHEELIEY
jgi:lysine 2,3-aminomutase